MSDEELIHKYVKESDIPDALKKLSEGYPVQYIIGNVEFYNTIINVNEHVLIPRFETEYLVDAVLKLINKYKIKNPDVIDLGTGSGCIAIAIKKAISCQITAIEKNNKSIEMAISNAKQNNVTINFINCDMFEYVENKKYDIIISNPPYVKRTSSYDKKILFEPEEAIFASGDGTEYYDNILKYYKNKLKSKYLIAFEIGDNQGEVVKNLAHRYLKDAKVTLKKDYNDYDRYVFITNYE